MFSDYKFQIIILYFENIKKKLFLKKNSFWKSKVMFETSF